MPMSPASSFTARVLSLALSVAACGDGAPASNPEARPADRATPAATPAEAPPKADPKLAVRPSVAEAKGTGAAQPVEGAVPPAAVPDGKIGVPECDEYIEKYAKCIMEKVPEPARPHMQEAMELSAKAWREAASGPAKDGVAATCKTALEAARQATESLGCDW
jgi:hypothetical protein